MLRENSIHALSQEESMSSSSTASHLSIFVPSDASLYTAQKELRGIFRGRPKVEDFGLGSVERLEICRDTRRDPER